MTLHVEVRIAGTVVHHVAVVNEGEATGSPGFHRYRWVADDRPHGPCRSGELLHRREAGAAALAASVLALLVPVRCECTLHHRCEGCREGLTAEARPIPHQPAEETP